MCVGLWSSCRRCSGLLVELLQWLLCSSVRLYLVQIRFVWSASSEHRVHSYHRDASRNTYWSTSRNCSLLDFWSPLPLLSEACTKITHCLMVSNPRLPYCALRPNSDVLDCLLLFWVSSPNFGGCVETLFSSNSELDEEGGDMLKDLSTFVVEAKRDVVDMKTYVRSKTFCGLLRCFRCQAMQWVNSSLRETLNQRLSAKKGVPTELLLSWNTWEVWSRQQCTREVASCSRSSTISLIDLPCHPESKTSFQYRIPDVWVKDSF
jgi:hypothetical protein